MQTAASPSNSKTQQATNRLANGYRVGITHFAYGIALGITYLLVIVFFSAHKTAAATPAEHSFQQIRIDQTYPALVGSEADLLPYQHLPDALLDFDRLLASIPPNGLPVADIQPDSDRDNRVDQDYPGVLFKSLNDVNDHDYLLIIVHIQIVSLLLGIFMGYVFGPVDLPSIRDFFRFSK